MVRQVTETYRCHETYNGKSPKAVLALGFFLLFNEKRSGRSRGRPKGKLYIIRTRCRMP
jgi:hypothetical protein